MCSAEGIMLWAFCFGGQQALTSPASFNMAGCLVLRGPPLVAGSVTCGWHRAWPQRMRAPQPRRACNAVQDGLGGLGQQFSCS